MHAALRVCGRNGFVKTLRSETRNAKRYSRSVPRHVRINLIRPRLDSTSDVVDLAETKLAEMFRRLLAAAAVMAQEGQRCVLCQCFERREAIVEGGEFGIDRSQRAFLARSHVDHAQRARL